MRVERRRNGRWLRLLASPFTLFATILFRQAAVDAVTPTDHLTRIDRYRVYTAPALRGEVAAFLRDVCTLHELEVLPHRWHAAQLLDRGIHLLAVLGPDLVGLLLQCAHHMRIAVAD